VRGGFILAAASRGFGDFAVCAQWQGTSGGVGCVVSVYLPRSHFLAFWERSSRWVLFGGVARIDAGRDDGRCFPGWWSSGVVVYILWDADPGDNVGIVRLRGIDR
jgi:hypothetical protein